MGILVIKTLDTCDVCGHRGTVVKLIGNRESIKFCAKAKCEGAIIKAIKIKAKEIEEGST